MDNWDKSLFTQKTSSDVQSELYAPQCIAVHLAENALSFTAALSRKCAAPQTTKRSRDLTVRAESLPGDSQRRKRRAITKECKQQSRPAKTQRTDPTISLDPPSGPTSPLSVTESKPSAPITDARAPARYFLDFCAGRNAPFVSCSHQNWTRSPGTPRRRPLARR